FDRAARERSRQGGCCHPAGSSSADDHNLADRMFAHAAILHALTVEASAKAEKTSPRPWIPRRSSRAPEPRVAAEVEERAAEVAPQPAAVAAAQGPARAAVAQREAR